MPSPSYSQNKVHIYKWVDKNKDKHNSNNMKNYYKMKIKCPIWRQIKYEYLAILL